MITLGTKSVAVPGSPQRIVFLGDSITAGVAFGPWFGTLAPAVEAAQIAAGFRGAFPVGAISTGGLPGPTSTHIWFNSGVAGDDCVTILAATIAARVAAYKPDVVFHFYGVNCVQHAISDATCITNHALLLAQTAAQCPGAQQICLGPLCIGEKSPDGQNANDAAIDAKNVIIANAAAAAGATYVNMRPAFFAYEAINNPGQANSGPLTTPDASFLHPNAAGINFIRDLVLPFIRYAP